MDGSLGEGVLSSRTRASGAGLTVLHIVSSRGLTSLLCDVVSMPVERSTTAEPATGSVSAARGTDRVGGMFPRRSKSEGRTVRTLAVLSADSTLVGGRIGSGRHPSGSEIKEIGRDEDSAMDVGRDEAGGVGGIVFEDRRLFMCPRMRSSSTWRVRSWRRESAAAPTTVAEEALVVAVVADAWECTLGVFGTDS